MIPRLPNLERRLWIAVALALVPVLLAPSLVADSREASEPDTLSFKVRWFAFVAFASPTILLANSVGFWPQVGGRTEMGRMLIQLGAFCFVFWLVVLAVTSSIYRAAVRLLRCV